MNFSESNYEELISNIQLLIMNKIFLYKDILKEHKAKHRLMKMMEFQILNKVLNKFD